MPAATAQVCLVLNLAAIHAVIIHVRACISPAQPACQCTHQRITSTQFWHACHPPPRGLTVMHELNTSTLLPLLHVQYKPKKEYYKEEKHEEVCLHHAHVPGTIIGATPLGMHVSCATGMPVPSTGQSTGHAMQSTRPPVLELLHPPSTKHSPVKAVPLNTSLSQSPSLQWRLIHAQ
jgi:hypothetical protein